MNPRRYHQRGSIYITVLLTVMIITIIGLSALAATQVQRRSVEADSHAAEARLYARSAVELGMHMVQNDPYWRTNLGNGQWVTDAIIGDGTYSISVSDPVDSNVTNNTTDPILITGKGTRGNAVYLLQVEMEAKPGIASLENALHADSEIAITSTSTVNSDQVISSNDDVNTSGGSNVYGIVQARDQVTGSTYHGVKNSNTSIREMPDGNAILNYYQFNGTNIAFHNIPTGDGVTNQLRNPGIEAGSEPWQLYPANEGKVEVITDAATSHSGDAHIRITERANANVGLEQNITNRLMTGSTYQFNAWAKTTTNDNFIVTIEYTTESGTGSVSRTITNVNSAGNWTRISCTITPNWAGLLLSARLHIRAVGTNDFYIDDVSLIEQPGGLRRIHNVLLSPENNPFDTGATDPNGIYVIDCNDADLIIANCRIVGTLVLIDPGEGTRIERSVVWEPAIENYPALIAEDEITMAFSNTALSEAEMGTNFNPAGTPYPYSAGTSNTDQTDAYPSVIRGLIYSTAEIKFKRSPTIYGVVLSDDEIKIENCNLTLKYNAVHLNNPPPAFGSIRRTMTLTPGTWKRIVLP